MAGTKGMKIPSRSVSKARKERMVDNWRESISATKIMKRLEDHADGKLEKELSPTQIKAYEVILSRLVPSLSAVEQTNVNEGETLTEEQILLKLQSLILGNRQMVEAILAASKKTPDHAQDCGVNTESAPHNAVNGAIDHPSAPITH